MSRHPQKKRVFMVEKYHEFQSSLKVIEAWKKEYPEEKPPTATTILYQVKKFHKLGSILELPRFRIKINREMEAAKNTLIDLINAYPRLSLRRAASAVGISHTSVRKFLIEDLNLKPYKIQEVQQLKADDCSKRVEFAEWVLSLPIEALLQFICSDEAYFYLSLPANKQNNQIWSLEKPFEVIERPLQDQKLLVWCAMTTTRIYGPYFFDESVNQHNYLQMLQDYFWPKHNRVEGYDTYYFQQDGATPHTAKIVQDWLKSKFGDFFLSKTKWPPRSPDLNPCDFFLWGYLKARVYNPLPKTLNDLRQNIEREIEKINEKMLKKVYENLKKRCSLIVSAEGGHFENIL